MEYKRQLKNQEDGLNKLTIQEYLDNIKGYKSNGRGTEAAKIQQKVRQDAIDPKDYTTTFLNVKSIGN